MMRTSGSRFPTDGFGLLPLILIVVVPIGGALIYALLYSVGAVGLLSTGLTPDAWAESLVSAETWTSFALSLYVSSATVLLSVTSAFALLLVFKKDTDDGNGLFYLPLAIPAAVAAFLVYELFSGASWISKILPFADGRFVNDRFAVGIILAHTGMAAPFLMLLFRSHYVAADVDSLSELARSLGAARGRIIRMVVAPVVLRRSFLAIVFVFITVLGSYEIPLLLGRQSPEMISVLTYRKYALFDISDKPEAFVLALLYTALVVAVLAVAFRRQRRWNPSRPGGRVGP